MTTGAGPGPCSQAWPQPPAGPCGARGAERSPRPASLGHPGLASEDRGCCGPPACARPKLSVPRSSLLGPLQVTWVCGQVPCARKVALVVMCRGWQKGGGPCGGVGCGHPLSSFLGVGRPVGSWRPWARRVFYQSFPGELGPSWGCWATGQAQTGLNQALPTPTLLGAWHKLLSLS